MKASFLYVAMLLAALPATAADPIDGKWQFHQNIVGNESDLSCTFTQKGADLSGTCESPSGGVQITGKVTENKVTFTYKSEYNGSPLTVSYAGTLTSATKMSGTVSVDPYSVEGEFSGTQSK